MCERQRRGWGDDERMRAREWKERERERDKQFVLMVGRTYACMCSDALTRAMYKFCKRYRHCFPRCAAKFYFNLVACQVQCKQSRKKPCVSHLLSTNPLKNRCLTEKFF